MSVASTGAATGGAGAATGSTTAGVPATPLSSSQVEYFELRFLDLLDLWP